MWHKQAEENSVQTLGQNSVDNIKAFDHWLYCQMELDEKNTRFSMTLNSIDQLSKNKSYPHICVCRRRNTLVPTMDNCHRERRVMKIVDFIGWKQRGHLASHATWWVLNGLKQASSTQERFALFVLQKSTCFSVGDTTISYNYLLYGKTFGNAQ